MKQEKVRKPSNLLQLSMLFGVMMLAIGITA